MHRGLTIPFTIDYPSVHLSIMFGIHLAIYPLPLDSIERTVTVYSLEMIIHNPHTHVVLYERREKLDGTELRLH